MCTTQQFCLRWNNHRSNLLSVFEELLQNQAFTDVTLVSEDGSPVRGHRMVLAACSPYFQNLFIDLPCKHPVVVLKDVNYNVIKAILEYMYRGEVSVAQDQLADLLKVAGALKVKGLVEQNRLSDTNLSTSREEEPMEHSSPIETSSAAPNVQNVHSSSSSSPPHSTNSLYKNPYNSIYAGKPSSNPDRNARMNMPMWAMPGLPIPRPASPVPNQHHPHPAATAATAGLNNCYDSAGDLSPLRRKKLSSLLMNRDTPILRTVLGQGQADSSQPVSLVCHSNNSHEQPSREPDEERMQKHMKNEPSEDAQSPYTDFTAMNDDEDKPKLAVPSSSPQSYTNEMRGISSNIANYVPAQKPEWKRYKQYTRDDIMSAINAVRNGMSALQASRKYGVPSRTLYDKVKKLGITTSRPFKRGSNGSPACFPYGLSGTDSPYGGHLSENDDPAMNNNTSSLLDASFLQHAFESRGGDDREALAAMAVAAAAHAVASGQSTSPPNPGHPTSPSPSPTLLKYMHANSMTSSPAPNSDHHHSETNGSSEREREEEDDEDQVEDLSVGSRKQESRVIMPPMNQVSTIMKKEELLRNLIKEEASRQVSVEETAD